MRLRRASIVVPLSILIFTAAYLTATYATLDGMSRRVPLLVAYATIFLLIFDIVNGLLCGTAAASAETDDEPIDVSPLREFYGISCVVGCFLTIYFAGFYVAIVAYIFVSIAFLGKQSLLTAVVASLVTCAAIYVVFNLLLGYPLFAGVLLS